MTRASTFYSRRRRAEQIAELSFRAAMNQARYRNAQEGARERAARARARYAGLRPLLARAGYGAHGQAARIRAEAQAIEARRAVSRSTGYTGDDCQVCAEGRRMDASRARSAPPYSEFSGPSITRGGGYVTSVR
jgi:hypothetical protein